MKTTRLWVLGATVLVVLLPAGVRADERAKPNTLTPKEVAEGWVLLFDGKTTKGWTSPNGSKWTVFGGMLAPRAGKLGLLVTMKEFGPCEIRLQCLAKARDSLKKPGPSEGEPVLLVGCGRDGTDNGFSALLPSYDSSWGNTGWVDVSVAMPQGGQGHTVDVTIIGRGFQKVGGFPLKDRAVRGHIGLSGSGVIFRSIKVRPLGTKKK